MLYTTFAPEGYITLGEAVFRFTLGSQSLSQFYEECDEVGAYLRGFRAKSVLRRALSSGRLRSFYTGAQGHIHPLKPHFWNSNGGDAIFAEGNPNSGYTWLPEWGEDGPPSAILVLEDEFCACEWLAADGSVQARGPVQACVAWLSDLMKQSPTTTPPPKEQLRSEAMVKFKGLKWRAFNRAWDMAKAKNPEATAWGKGGRKPDNPERNP
jgi:hypothetical protein